MPLSALLEKHYIGRNQEIESLFSLHAQVKEGIASSIFLSGERGTGKTELLRQLYQLLFWKQHNAVPFYYAVNPAFASVYDLCNDYLSRFLLQWLSFQKKDIALIHANGLPMERLLRLAEKSEAYWAVDIIENFLQIKTAGDAIKLFLTVIHAPYNSYRATGIPVLIMIDDFQRLKKLSAPNAENRNNMWMLFEELINSKQTPHILTGSQAELQEMFFEKTSLGESLELFHLSGLDKITSLRLFTSLCESYGLQVDRASLFPFIDMLNGNPLYMKNFISAIRNEGKTLSEDDLWRGYLNGITSGKFYTSWTSQLRTCIQPLELRKVSLEMLHHLCSRGASTAPSTIATMFSISMQDLNSIVKIFQTAGIMEINFSLLKLIDDAVLAGVIKGLYSREILEKQADAIKEKIKNEYQLVADTQAKTAGKGLFEVTVPLMPRAELVAVSTLEHIARAHGIASEIIGQMQMAIADLFTHLVPPEAEPVQGNINFKFKSDKDIFTIEIKTPYRQLPSLSSPDAPAEKQFMRRYFDDFKLEGTKSGTNIMLTKNLKRAFVPAS